MLRYLVIAIYLSAVSCGQQVESDVSGGNTFLEAEPQGFMITEMSLSSADKDCNSQFGAYFHFKSQEGKEISHVECFNYKRTKAEVVEEKSYSRRFPGPNETAGLDFSADTLQEFCEQNGIKDLGAMLFGDGDRTNWLNKAIRSYSCKTDGKKVIKLDIKNPSNEETFFDMRTLKYFPNLKELIIETNTIYAPETFDAPKGLSMLVLKLVEGDDAMRQDLFYRIAKNLKNVRFLEIYNFFETTADIKVDATFISHLTNLEVLLSATELSNISTLNGHRKLKHIELPNSDQGLDLGTLKQIVSIRYEADQSSNLNWNDRKFFSIFNQTFVR